MARFRRLPLAATLALGTLFAGPAAAIDLPFGLGGARERAPVAAQAEPMRLAQAGDGGIRLSQMEEEMRRLTGKVEELSFLVLQLQEQLRKTQEDNEFRFQDLEGARSGAAGGAAAPERRTELSTSSGSQAAGAPPALPRGDTFASAGTDTGTPTPRAPDTASTSSTANPAGADEISTILDTSLAESASVDGPSTRVAAIPANGPVELYSLGYNYMLAGDYHLAENTFRQYTQTYPDASDAPDAQYWLGEALFAQAKYRDAAEVFLNAQKTHPQAAKAPEMMLKLGMSLAHLDNRETACVTYSEVGRRYPGMSVNVKRKLEVEEKTARCS